MPPDFKLTRHRGVFAVTYIDEKGERRRRTTGTADAVEAARFLEAYQRNLAAPKAISVSSILDHHLRALEGRASAKIAEHQAKPLRRAFGGLLPMQITREAVEAYVAGRAAQGRKPWTIRSEVALLSTALNRAEKDRLIAERPHIPIPAEGPARDLFLTREQFGAIMAACPSHHVKLFLLIAISTGARATAILELTWDRVNLDAGLIDFRKSVFARMKGRAVAPMTPTLKAALSQAKEMAIGPHVIEQAGEPLARIVRGVKAAGARVRVPWLSPHVLRHTAARWMAEDGVSMAEIAAVLGHKNSRVTEATYAKFSPTYLKKAVASLDVGTFAPAATMDIRRSGKVKL